MFKYLSFVLFFIITLNYLGANNESDLVLKSNTSIFSGYYIPTKYKKESAIILAQEFHFVAQNSTQYLWVKQKVLVKDWNGVDSFKSLYFVKGYQEDTVIIYKNNGQKISNNFSPISDISTVNPPIYFSFYERKPYFEYQKMDLNQLQLGDTLEFSYKIKTDFISSKSFNFSKGSNYPIIKRVIGVLHQNNFVVNARYTSPDIKFKTAQKNIEQQISVIEFLNLDKSLERYNIPLEVKNPSVSIEISTNKLPSYKLLVTDKLGVINETADMEQIKQNVHQRVLANTKILELKNKVLYFATIAKFGDIREVDNKRKVAAAFYIFRDQVFNQKKLPSLDVDLFFYYWLKVCKANKWKYQIGFTFPKSNLLATQILSMEDVYYFIEIEGIRIFPNLNNPHQELKFIPFEVQGAPCYSTNFNKKFHKLKWLNSTIPTQEDNIYSVDKKLFLNGDDFTWSIKDSIYTTGYGKLIHQRNLFKNINFANTDYKHAGIRPVYNYSPKSAEERSAEKLAEKMYLDTINQHYKIFLQSKGVLVDSLWSLIIKEEGRSEKYEKRISIAQYNFKANVQNNGLISLPLANVFGDDIVCKNDFFMPELSNNYFNNTKTFTLKISIPQGYQFLGSSLSNQEINSSNFFNSINYQVKDNDLWITINQQIKQYKLPLKYWKDHLDFCLLSEKYFNQKIYFQKL